MNLRKRRIQLAKSQADWKKRHPIRAKRCINRYMRSPFGRFSQSKYRAKKRGIIFTLTFDQFSNLIKQPCFYCKSKPNSNTTGFWLDRLNNKKGYITNNVVPCCKICNVMKNNLSFNEFKEHISKIVTILKLA